MKPFHFRLARFLRLNEAERRQFAIALAQENHKLDAELQILDDRRTEQLDVQRSYASLAGQHRNVNDWLGAERALTGAKSKVKKQSQLVKQAEARVEKARDELVKKSSEVETLKRLRERKRREYDIQYRRHEQKQIDEKAVERFAQSQQAASRDPHHGTGKNFPALGGNPGPAG
jgi:flagellar export protein FliJ